jgi:hypothetical protein
MSSKFCVSKFLDSFILAGFPAWLLSRAAAASGDANVCSGAAAVWHPRVYRAVSALALDYVYRANICIRYVRWCGAGMINWKTTYSILRQSWMIPSYWCQERFCLLCNCKIILLTRCLDLRATGLGPRRRQCSRFIHKLRTFFLPELLCEFQRMPSLPSAKQWIFWFRIWKLLARTGWLWLDSWFRSSSVSRQGQNCCWCLFCFWFTLT